MQIVKDTYTYDIITLLLSLLVKQRLDIRLTTYTVPIM